MVVVNGDDGPMCPGCKDCERIFHDDFPDVGKPDYSFPSSDEKPVEEDTLGPAIQNAFRLFIDMLAAAANFGGKYSGPGTLAAYGSFTAALNLFTGMTGKSAWDEVEQKVLDVVDDSAADTHFSERRAFLARENAKSKSCPNEISLDDLKLNVMTEQQLYLPQNNNHVPFDDR